MTEKAEEFICDMEKYIPSGEDLLHGALLLAQLFAIYVKATAGTKYEIKLGEGFDPKDLVDAVSAVEEVAGLVKKVMA